MAFKIGKMVTHALIIGLLVAILVIQLRTPTTVSTFIPAPIETKPTSAVARKGGSLFDMKPSLECTPGPSENASYYTMGLTPGGLCGDGEAVQSQLRDFSIENGIGGSLLEK